MPARTVVFTSVRKFDGKDMRHVGLCKVLLFFFLVFLDCVSLPFVGVLKPEADPDSDPGKGRGGNIFPPGWFRHWFNFETMVADNGGGV